VGKQAVKIGSLCTGYGGLDMAVEAYFNAEMVWCAEIDKYASQLIEQRFNKPNLGDIKQIKWDEVEPVDILTAGYPCQPFSTAGQRKGTQDERHIWPYIIEAICTIRPSIVVLENVRGHLSLGFKEVLSDLAKNGYDARWQIVRASDVGAPHQRARLFIIAYPKGGWSRVKSIRISQSNTRAGCNSEFVANSSGKGLQGAWYKTNDFTNGIIANSNSDACEESRRASREIPTESGRLQTGQNVGQTRSKYRCSCEMVEQEVPATLVEGKLNAKFVEYMMGLPNGWVTDLNFSRTQQLKMLGNGVVPQQAYYALQLSNE
jgi:DNA (cytosine-5)-methyltransferase 1